ncbi:MAG: HAD-IC family P-type ATPase, partial [Clostridia bacterium]
ASQSNVINAKVSAITTTQPATTQSTTTQSTTTQSTTTQSTTTQSTTTQPTTTQPTLEAQIVENVVAEEKPAKKEKKSISKSAQKKALKKLLASEMTRVDADMAVGLNDEQIEERRVRNYTNIQPNIITKSYTKIFTSNVFTLFNIINFFLASVVIVYGQLKNALFIGIIVFNMIIGIIQEIRSKRTLEKMSLLTKSSVCAVRNGAKKDISIEDIVLDDIILLKQGMQVPADSIVLSGECEVNESLLTGEQDDVHKHIGDKMMSGSFVQAGDCCVRVQAVGEENFSAKIMAEAKKFKKSKSELMRSINWIVKIVSIIIFPLGILMLFTNMSTAPNINRAVTNTVASIVGMIPEGLVMLTSVALAVGIVKLAKKRTLVQDLYCIETLARVDVLCLDKTGTITEGTMQVEQTHMYSTKNGDIDVIMANMVKALGANGATFEAFSKYFHSNETFETKKLVPFSSARKWSGADFGANGRFIVGAPEFVLKSRYNIVEDDAKEFTAQGFRVLILVKTNEELKETMDESKMRPIALIILSDKIRENAKATFDYFAAQGVALKVISGDNPLTVSKVAERAGLSGSDKFIDASVDLDTPEKIFDACDKYTIFGRVSPSQKKQLVTALKAKGYTVGMTGDGVNDVMALKEADCSIAMASGSDASRNVSQLVLQDSDFAALPSVVAEGRRVINNIERAASLFLVKTTFSIVLTLFMIIFQMNYPFEPIQLTLIGGLFVGIPSFFLALEPNDTKVTGNFLGKVFKKALPAGISVAIMAFIVSFVYKDIGMDVTTQVSTMVFYITSLISFIVLMQVCMPYNKERLFLIAMCSIAFLAVISSDILRTLFSISPLTTDMIIKLIIMMVCSLPLIVLMRAEVEAFKALFREIKDFFVNTYKKAKGLFGQKEKRKKW